MARRSDIDWEAVERDYRAGVTSVSAVAEKHGVSLSQVKIRAKRDGWTRDLSSEIRARAKAKVAQIDVQALVEQSASESAGKSAKLIKRAIEEASDVAAGVIVRHRADIRLQHERAMRLEALFDEMIDKTPNSMKIPFPRFHGPILSHFGVPQASIPSTIGTVNDRNRKMTVHDTTMA